MNILLLAPTYQDLYKPIIEELEKIGHHVTFIEDIVLPYSFLYKNKKTWKKRVYEKIFTVGKVPERYWEKMIAKSPLLNQFYEVLFCINGASFHPFLLKHLQRYNPNIRTSLYIWDTCRYFDFMYQKRECFDKIYTFDYKDSLEQNINYLPFYWCPLEIKEKETKYAISIVGSDHDGRYNIVKKIAKQLRTQNIPFCFRIVVSPNKISKYQDTEIVTTQKLSLQETLSIMMVSECVLDTDRESQTGTTPRLIWALALGKKVITTNTNIKELPLYTPKQIQIIDRKSPIIDFDFIKRNVDKHEITATEYVKQLCITEWIQNFL